MFTSARQHSPTLLSFVGIFYYRKKVMEPYPGGHQNLIWNHLTPALKISVSPEGKKNARLLQPYLPAYFHPDIVRPFAIFWVLGSTVLRTLGWCGPFALQSNKVLCSTPKLCLHISIWHQWIRSRFSATITSKTLILHLSSHPWELCLLVWDWI